MPPKLHPTPLTPGQRLGLLVWRGSMATFGAFVRFRPGGPTEPTFTWFYGSGHAESVEYIPPRSGEPVRDPVVYIHGGGWICGKRELYTRDLLFLSEAGYPVLNIEYPLAPENPHPGILLSLLRAMQWLRGYRPEWDRFHFMGDSAGGNLAAMMGLLTANPELLKNLDPELDPVGLPKPLTMTSLYGVLDRLSWLKHGFPSSRLMLESYGGKEAFEERVGPELALTPLDLDFESFPPTFIAAASKDPLAESSLLCAAHLQSRTGEVEHKVYEGENHGFFNMGWRPASQQLKNDILTFLASH